MKSVSRKWWISIVVTIGLLALLGITGAAIAQKPESGKSIPSVSSPLAPGGGPSEPMAFSYQGRLEDGGAPANGNMAFSLSTCYAVATTVASLPEMSAGSRSRSAALAR